jgi:predicted phosphodiesterase
MDTFFTTPDAGFAGDWHGDTGWALRCLELFHERGISTVYHVGDFGVWGGTDGASYLRKLNKRLLSYDMRLIVVPGNHENYDMIERWPVNDEGFQSRTTDAPSIWYAPRGHTWTHNGAKFVALGGAFSIDKELRAVGRSWWPQEAITPEDVQRLITNLDTLEWDVVDVFLSHEIPAGLDVGQKAFNLPPELEWESYQQRKLLREAVDRAAPKTLVHGHWHKYLRNTLEGVTYDLVPYVTDVHGLDCNRFNNNIMTADVVEGTGLVNVVMIPWK